MWPLHTAAALPGVLEVIGAHTRRVVFLGSGGVADLTMDEQEEMFARSGQVNSATVVSDRYSGQSKGFGFVEMENESEADAAINSLNGTMMNGRSLTVNEAKPAFRTNSRADGLHDTRVATDKPGISRRTH